MPRVLLISFTYPPGFGSGGIRISKYAKFLPEFGWEPYVLTVDPRRYPFQGGFESLIGKAPVVATDFFDPLSWVKRLYPLESKSAGGESSSAKESRRRRFIQMIRPAAKYIWDLIYFPDPQIGWYPYAVQAGRRIIQKNKIDVVFSSSPPHTDHLVGASLAKRHHLPWVAEYRDPWTGQHTYQKYWPMPMMDRWLERRTLSGASGIITISSTMARILSEKLGRPVEVIENGFDPDDLPAKSAGTAGPFVLLHAGTLYRGQRDPGLLFEGLKILKEKLGLTPNRFQIHFVGVRSEMASDFASRHGVTELVKVFSREPYPDAIRRQSQATALLLLGVNDPMGGGVLTGKMFEFFGLRRPIFCVSAPDRDLEEIILRTRTGQFVTTPGDVAEGLSRWIEEFERTGGVGYRPNENETNKYHRRECARKLSEILNISKRG